MSAGLSAASRGDTCLLSYSKSGPRGHVGPYGRCFALLAVAVVNGPRRTGLLPGTSESAGSHEPAGAGCQTELVIESSESETV